jgi:renin receptor
LFSIDCVFAMAVLSQLRFYGLFIFYALFSVYTSSSESGSYTVLYSPSYTKFLETTDALDTAELSGVVLATLGLPLSEDLKWNGLAEGSLFRRPKANVILSILDTKNKPFSRPSIYQNTYPTRESGLFDSDAVIDNIEQESWKQDPLCVDFSVESSVIAVRSRRSDLFSRLPSTLYGLGDNFVTEWFTVDRLRSLNITQDADLLFVGELYAILDIINALKEHRDVTQSKSPDLYHFTLSGLRSLSERYGSDSTKLSDAYRLLNTFLQKITTDLREIYKDSVVIQAVSFTSASDNLIVRKTRSLLQDNANNGTDLNLAPEFSNMYAAIFNIILWIMIGFALAIFGISWGIWNMDPGRDSLIYRMTSQRMKRD